MKKTIFILIIFYIISGNLNTAERRRFEKSSYERDPNTTAHSHHGSSTDELFDLQFSFPLGVGDGEAGIECDGNYFYTTKWNGNVFYKYELDGTYIGEFTVDGCPGSIRDLAYDGQYFYGAAATNTVYEMDFDTQTTISTINAPIAVRAIAYDPIADGFWANNWSDAITLFDRSGSFVNSFPCGSFSSFYGFAWEDVLPGGPYLWGYCQDGPSQNQLVQFEIATGVETGVNFDVSNATPLTGMAGGLYITDQIFPGLWIIGGLCQNDVIWGLELAYCDCPHPGAPTDVFVIPNAGGVLTTEINWICPTETVGGSPLPELLEMRVYRDNELIYTDFDPVIGGPGNCTDNTVPISGLYVYKVVGYNSYGEGIPVIETVWIGEDMPAAVDNLLLEDISIGDTLIAKITWDNPTTGLHGGAFNEPILGYHILRHPDNIVFELIGIHIEWIDDTITIPSYYYYDVTPYNSVGDGGTATSNIWPPPANYIYEDFSSGSFPPDGWYIDGLGQTNWSASTSNNAGGYAPEAKFSWTPTFIGISRLVTYPIDTSGISNGSVIELEFKYMINDFNGDYILRLETTSDGINWNVAAVLPSEQTPATVEFVEISTPDIGSETLQIAWVFDGDSFNIDYWYIDDIIGFDVYWYGEISGIVMLNGGTGNVEDVIVTANADSTHPDSTGYYEFYLWPGIYTLSASLDRYYPETVENVELFWPDSAIVDFTLNPVVESENELIPISTELIGNYPNPFNPETTISYQLTADSKVNLKVFNIKGRLVETLVNELKPAGKHSKVWNAENQASGIYFYKLKSGDIEISKKMLMIK
jgi:hypothetical protein